MAKNEDDASFKTLCAKVASKYDGPDPLQVNQPQNQTKIDNSKKRDTT